MEKAFWLYARLVLFTATPSFSLSFAKMLSRFLSE
jgi:hypothetical protein